MNRKPAKRGLLLMQIRHAMTEATAKFQPGGMVNEKRKPVTLRRADYERQKANEIVSKTPPDHHS